MMTNDEPLIPRPIARPPVRMSIDAMIEAEVEARKEAGELDVVPSPETRCRICMEDATRVLVNKLLAHGLTFATILTILEPVNKTRKKNNKINRNSLYNHQSNHFNVQEPARAVYRTILQKRAKESEIDFVKGIGHAVDFYSYLETVMVKGYAQLTSELDNVTVEMGMTAAMKLHEMTKKDAGVQQAAEQQYQMNKIISAVKEVVPEQYFSAILARINGNELDETVLDVEVESDDEGFDPVVADDDEYEDDI